MATSKPSFLDGIAMEFRWENAHGGWATILVLMFLFAWRLLKPNSTRPRGGGSSISANAPIPINSNSGIGVSDIITDADLRNLMDNLNGKVNESEQWEDVIDKKSTFFSYKAKCCKPKDEPLKYRSVMTFENCSTELLRDFYLDNEYRKEWDKTLVEHEQLQIDKISGTEIGFTIKKFPLLTPREYVLAWRVWEGKDKSYYCFIKEIEHPRVPRQKKYVRVEYFRSGWCIRKVPGRDACEIAMVHQEDAGLNVEMTKIAFAKGIWSYVCKMDLALRKYSTMAQGQRGARMTALKLIQRVPSELETMTTTPDTFGNSKIGTNKISRKKSILKGLLLVGSIFYLSRGHASVGAKMLTTCILKKVISKHTSRGNHEEKKLLVS